MIFLDKNNTKLGLNCEADAYVTSTVQTMDMLGNVLNTATNYSGFSGAVKTIANIEGISGYSGFSGSALAFLKVGQIYVLNHQTGSTVWYANGPASSGAFGFSGFSGNSTSGFSGAGKHAVTLSLPDSGTQLGTWQLNPGDALAYSPQYGWVVWYSGASGVSGQGVTIMSYSSTSGFSGAITY